MGSFGNTVFASESEESSSCSSGFCIGATTTVYTNGTSMQNYGVGTAQSNLSMVIS